MAETSNFYFLYDIKQESIPEEDEWALRYEKFVKHIPPSEDENVKYALPTEDESVKHVPPHEDENIPPSEGDENISEDENNIIKLSKEEGKSVENMGGAKLSQFEENLAEQTLSNERSSIKRELWPF